MASTTTIAAVLKRYYTDGGVAEQINNESLVTKLFERSTQQWGGSTLHIPVHTGRNTGVGNIPEGGAYPTAGAQVYADLVVDSMTLAGRGNITRKMMKKAKKARNPRAAFLSYWDAEVTRIKDDLINLSCQRMISGGKFPGVINTKAISGASAGNFVGGGAVVPAGTGVDFQYFGDLTPFEDCDVTDSSTWVSIELFRMDNYAQIIPAGNDINALMVSSSDSAALSIEIRYVGETAAGHVNSSVTTNIAALLAAGKAVAVGLGAQVQDRLNANFGTISSFANQQAGIFTNLCDPQHFTVARADAGTLPVANAANPAANNALQSHIFVNNVGLAPQNRTGVDTERIQRCMDDAFNSGGKEIDCILINARTRSAYVQQTTATLTVNNQGGKKADMGFSSLSYAGMPFKLSQHLLAAISCSTWAVGRWQSLSAPALLMKTAQCSIVSLAFRRLSLRSSGTTTSSARVRIRMRFSAAPQFRRPSWLLQQTQAIACDSTMGMSRRSWGLQLDHRLTTLLMASFHRRTVRPRRTLRLAERLQPMWVRFLPRRHP